MPRRRLPRALSALVLALAGCGAPGPGRDANPAADTTEHAATVHTYTDADGRQVRVAVPVTRVVSLVPSATMTLDALGARGVLVARTDYDTAAWAADLPSVGGGLQPSIEALVAARPELVIRFGGSQDTRTPARLDDLGIPQLAIRPDGIADVLSTVRTLGDLTGRVAAADSLVAAIRAELEDVRTRVQGTAPVRVAYVLGGDPPWVAGPGTYISELMTLAGGTNVFSDLGRLYAPVSPEELVERDIDVVLLAAGSTLDRALVQGSRVVEVNGDVERPGPDVGRSARDVARAIHPEAFP
jgi:iron complex transport system substrate-binding protein